MKLPPYARQMNVPRDNKTVYVFVGWFSRKQANNITQMRGMVLPDGECPYDYTWPVQGCGVIVMDYVNMDDRGAMTLACALRDAGAESVIWANFIKNETGFLIEGKNNDGQRSAARGASRRKAEETNVVHMDGRSGGRKEADRLVD